MGWFWSDLSPNSLPPSTIAPHPVSSPDAKPPPGCPMHNSSSTNSPFRKPLLSESKPSPASKSCPYAPPTAASTSVPTNSSPQSEQPSTGGTSSWMWKINPLNLMPSLPNAPTTSSQTVSLPLEREGSSIPRGPCAPSSKSAGGCPYPSPQQMYNALLRKGYTDTDPTAVPAMVSVHNFLNEGAWAEILEWERRFSPGLYTGWRISSRGEENSYFGAMTELEEDGWRKAMRKTPEPRLLRFEGRPQDRTPRSRWLELLGKVWPTEYSSAPPFDRHDWYVLRHMPDGSTKEVRYVIDYYSGPTETTGEPVFYLDVRPAIDGPTGFGERILRWGGDAWWRASGGTVREQSELERKIQEARERRNQHGER
ncbi:hypothetical protein NA57DRAFT_41598 [Rhizodiscina lignyota]|uniref:Holocytochrome c-type synthase n=1 Tax=Rhizodiscina lignyota TaxID=1504668 RepID=A0A9P4IAD1_9PEZI|nr:hypothetical protein NA57DRAFT_41598 [Rhizodiscina lignyota]